MERPTNLAHTTAALPFHMDNCWYESPPGLQFLHCIRLDMRIYHTIVICCCPHTTPPPLPSGSEYLPMYQVRHEYVYTVCPLAFVV